MWLGKRIAVVVPALNEEERIGGVIAGMPAWVDAIFVVDDGSRDATASVVHQASAQDGRIQLLQHGERKGVGAALVTGYQAALAEVRAPYAAVAVMAGDGQMDAADLAGLVNAVVSGHCDYAKGTRHGLGRAQGMPWLRWVGTQVFGAMTGWATGLGRLHDAQCGYTVLSARALKMLPWDRLWRGYGYPNDLLGWCGLLHLRVRELPVRAVYRGERSLMRPRHALVIGALILRVAWRRWVRFAAG